MANDNQPPGNHPGLDPPKRRRKVMGVEVPPLTPPSPEPSRPPLIRKVTPPPIPILSGDPVVIRDAPAPVIEPPKMPSMLPGTHYPVKRAAKLGGLAVGSAGAIVIAAIGVLPQLVNGPTKKAEQPTPIPIDCASQETLDRVQIEQMKIRARIKLQAELLCALNGGSPGGGWHCDQQNYTQPRQTPPFYRTDKIYPSDD